MKKILWKSIPGYESYYEISNFGEIRSLNRFVKNSAHSFRFVPGKTMRQRFDKIGRAYVDLQRERKKRTFFVHRLVLLAFVGQPPHGCVCLHGPNGVSDNNLSNLSYGTMKKNNSVDKERDGTLVHGEAHGRHKLTVKQVYEIYERSFHETQQTIADDYGISQTLVSLIHRGKKWRRELGI